MKDKDDFKGEDLLRFDLDEDFSTETAIVVCELYRRDKSWKFSAVALLLLPATTASASRLRNEPSMIFF